MHRLNYDSHSLASWNRYFDNVGPIYRRLLVLKLDLVRNYLARLRRQVGYVWHSGSSRLKFTFALKAKYS